jgi:phosphatidylglycerol:prolipoprotein diacylglycerol transferase
MHPVLTTVHVGHAELPIASYGVLLAVALLTGALGTLHETRRTLDGRPALELGAVITALGLAIAFGFAGALFVHGAAQLARTGSLAAALEQPGVSVLGALLGGAGAIALSAGWLGLSAPDLLDRAVPWVALAQAIGRVGCLLGGCCYGVVGASAWSVDYPTPAGVVSRVPVPLLEAAFLLALALFFARLPESLARRLDVPGMRVASYLALYALVRLLLEPLRGDAVRGVYFGGTLSTAQLLAVLVLAGSLAFTNRRVRGR